MGGLSKTIVGLKRGLWTLEEDKILTQYISSHGEGHWDLLAKSSGLRRTGKSCRLRWLNYLKPDIKRGKLTLEEQLRILQLHSMWGNRWSKIAQHLPGRTDNEIKNYWRTRVQRQAHHLKIAANSKAFQEVIQHFWIPRLLQKIQKSSPSPSATLSQNSTTTLINHSTFNTSSFSSSEYPTSCPIQATSNSDFCTTFQKGDCNQLNISRNDSTFCILSTEASFEENTGEVFLERESNFIDNGDLEDGLWNMDETWELMKLQEGSMYDIY